MRPVLSDSTRLVTLRTVTNGALKSDTLPSRLKLLAWGKSESVKGDVILDDLSAQVFAQNQKLIGRERVALDFEHNTVDGSPEFQRTTEPRKVAAFGAPKIIPGDGLYLEDITWTPTGQSEAKNFEDLSPAPFREDSGRIVGLHSAALTRAGAIGDLHFFSAAHTIQALSNHMIEQITLSELAVALGLKADAKKSEVLVKLTALSAPPASVIDAAGITALSTRIEAIEKASIAIERGSILADATRAGKVVPLSADEMATMPVATLRSLVEKLPAGIVPLNARSAGVRESKGANPEEAQKQIGNFMAANKCDYLTAHNTVRRAQPQLFGV